MGATTWTDERIETLTRLWTDGQSASQIARKFGLTRNAIIGKVHRLGLYRNTPHVPLRFADEAKTVWTPDKTAELRNLWLTDKTREQIAEVLGEGFSTMSVGAKAKRLGLVNRRTGPHRPKRKNAVRSNTAADKVERATIKQAFRGEMFEPLDGVTPKPFWERRLDECRWPITGPDDTDGVSRLSCCAPRVGNSSYCRTHRALGVAADSTRTRVGYDQASHRRRG
jgi:hypothetical protein